MHKYHKSRYRARKKYYDKEENKEKKKFETLLTWPWICGTIRYTEK